MPLIYLEEINQAITEAQVLKLTYLSNSTGQVTDREVEPYTLLSYEGRWYLIAYCRLRKGMRDFRVDRIQDLKMANQTFEVPPDFDLDAYLGPAFGMYRGDRSYAVHIRFSPYQARWIREEQWHESQMMVERADGSLDLRMQATGLSDLARWVLSYGGEAEVISPPVLRHRIAREVRRMQELYKDDTLVRPDEAEPNN